MKITSLRFPSLNFLNLDHIQSSRGVDRTWRLLCSNLVVVASFVILFAAGCDGFFPDQSKTGPPADHTVDEGRGAKHKKGAEHPLRLESGCSDSLCHQADLRGGLADIDGQPAESPSCYQCHDENWDDDLEDALNDDVANLDEVIPSPMISRL